VAAVDTGVVDELNTEDVRVELAVSGNVLLRDTHNIKTSVLLLHGLCSGFDRSIGVDIDLERLDIVARDGFDSFLSLGEVAGTEENMVFAGRYEFADGLVADTLLQIRI
jgi:hypothetical protein